MAASQRLWQDLCFLGLHTPVCDLSYSAACKHTTTCCIKSISDLQDLKHHLICQSVLWPVCASYFAATLLLVYMQLNGDKGVI